MVFGTSTIHWSASLKSYFFTLSQNYEKNLGIFDIVNMEDP